MTSSILFLVVGFVLALWFGVRAQRAANERNTAGVLWYGVWFAWFVFMATVNGARVFGGL